MLDESGEVASPVSPPSGEVAASGAEVAEVEALKQSHANEMAEAEAAYEAEKRRWHAELLKASRRAEAAEVQLASQVEIAAQSNSLSTNELASQMAARLDVLEKYWSEVEEENKRLREAMGAAQR